MMPLILRGRRRCLLRTVDIQVVVMNSLVLDQVALFEAGQVSEARHQFLADYGIIYSNGAPVGEGPQACIEQMAGFLSSAQNLKGQIADLYIDAESEFCAFRCSMNFQDETGVNAQIDSLHVQMWAGDNIASEWIYTGEPMMQMITRGVLDDPAHILELIG
jgi:hypothetical protein